MNSLKKTRHIRDALDDISGFGNPKLQLEQYMTPAGTAYDILSAIQNYCSMEDSLFIDFGCGTGMLSMASLNFGAGFVIAMDIDVEALEIFRANLNGSPSLSPRIDLILMDVLSGQCIRRATPCIGISNPPFGTKSNTGIDMMFVKVALLQTSTLFSLHKTECREFIKQKFKNATPLAEIKFNLGKTYRFHKKENKDIRVDLIQFKS